MPWPPTACRTTCVTGRRQPPCPWCSWWMMCPLLTRTIPPSTCCLSKASRRSQSESRRSSGLPIENRVARCCSDAPQTRKAQLGLASLQGLSSPALPNLPARPFAADCGCLQACFMTTLGSTHLDACLGITSKHQRGHTHGHTDKILPPKPSNNPTNSTDTRGVMRHGKACMS